jgi:hypothetical protein
MKQENKAALKSGGLAFLIGGLVAVCASNPVVWGAAAYGAYKMGKAAKYKVKSCLGSKGGSDYEPDLFI